MPQQAVAIAGDYLPASYIAPNVLNSILDAISGGEATHIALAQHGINRRTFYCLLAQDDEAANRYMRAKRAGCYAFADDTIEIQDERPPTISTKFGEVTDAAWVTWQKNRVIIRQWHLTKLMAKVYGDRLDVDAGGASLTISIAPQDDKL